MTTIQFRTDENLKKKAQKVFREMGMDLSTGINIYLKQVVVTESIPFPVRTVNGFTLEQEQEIIRETDEALKHGKRYKSAKELHRDILGEDY